MEESERVSVSRMVCAEDIRGIGETLAATVLTYERVSGSWCAPRLSGEESLPILILGDISTHHTK
jgi:hypothetical protein